MIKPTRRLPLATIADLMVTLSGYRLPDRRAEKLASSPTLM